MSRIRHLELLFNLEKENLKSKEDCVVVAIHCLLLRENFYCVGIGDEWPKTISTITELLPSGWNNNQDVYSLRYISKDLKSHILIKLTKMEHILQVDVVKNEDSVTSMPIVVEHFIADHDEYATAYRDLDSLYESFKRYIMDQLQPEEKKRTLKVMKKKHFGPSRPTSPPKPKEIGGRPRCPNVGGRDLDPIGRGGGMFMDPSPSRPSLQDFGVGGPGGLPRGSVPPGARFDPIRPPFPSTSKSDDNPNEFRPPDDDDDDCV